MVASGRRPPTDAPLQEEEQNVSDLLPAAGVKLGADMVLRMQAAPRDGRDAITAECRLNPTTEQFSLKKVGRTVGTAQHTPWWPPASRCGALLTSERAARPHGDCLAYMGPAMSPASPHPTLHATRALQVLYYFQLAPALKLALAPFGATGQDTAYTLNPLAGGASCHATLFLGAASERVCTSYVVLVVHLLA